MYCDLENAKVRQKVSLKHRFSVCQIQMLRLNDVLTFLKGARSVQDTDEAPRG